MSFAVTATILLTNTPDNSHHAKLSAEDDKIEGFNKKMRTASTSVIAKQAELKKQTETLATLESGSSEYHRRLGMFEKAQKALKKADTAYAKINESREAFVNIGSGKIKLEGDDCLG
jgi:multidrug resistance efflux pump